MRAWWAAAALVMMPATGAWAADSPATIPVESFFKKSNIGSATMSPDGRHVAITFAGKEGLHQLFVLDTATLTPKFLTAFNDADVVDVHWVSDKRIVYSAGSSDNQVSQGNVSPGLYAIDVDGGSYRQLARVEWHMLLRGQLNEKMLDATTHFVTAMHDDNSDSIIVRQVKFDRERAEFESVNFLKLDTRTGEAHAFNRPGPITDGVIAPDDTPRVVTSLEGKGQAAVQYLEGDKWVRLAEFNIFGDMRTFDPIAFGPDGTLFVAYSKDGGPTSLYTYDLKAKKLAAEPILTLKGFDVNAPVFGGGPLPKIMKSPDGRIAGFRFESDAPATYWIDAGMKALQAKIDKALPATINLIDAPSRAEAPYVLVRSFSDVNPGEFYLYDTKAEKLVSIGRARPWVDPAKMGRRDFVRYRARDGLEIPAWVTTPRDASKGPRPMVVLVHGGPWVRGGWWRWNPLAEFLASRGYVVLEPEYRGSLGFGFNHFKASWKQWGLAMQDDVADGTRWAIEKGIADPKRVCIAGASYGGYATLMGLARDADLYRCGFEWVGVTDLDLMYTATWSDMSDLYKRYGMPVLMGDRNKDAEQLKATSPVNVASRITQPLLMGYGADDVRVPIDHGTSFRDAVAKYNKDVEWVVYPEEGHGWRKLKDNVDWWTRVEKFLARNIGDGAAKQ